MGHESQPIMPERGKKIISRRALLGGSLAGGLTLVGAGIAARTYVEPFIQNVTQETPSNEQIQAWCESRNFPTKDFEKLSDIFADVVKKREQSPGSVPLSYTHDISFDGKRVVYPVPNQGLFMADANDSLTNASQISFLRHVGQDVFEMFPRFSPDGKKIAYVRMSGIKAESELMLFDLETTLTHQLTNLNGEYYLDSSGLAWSPDSSMIGYSISDDQADERGGIRVSRVPFKTSSGRWHSSMMQVTDRDSDDRIGWTPDSKQVTFYRLSQSAAADKLHVANVFGADKNVRDISRYCK
jgi:hypothetical protein